MLCWLPAWAAVVAWRIDSVTDASAWDCSPLALAISPARSTTLVTLPTMLRSAVRVLSAILTPWSTFALESSMSSAVSLAAFALRSARLRTSCATTAKPLP